jgi:hypothetical protein
MRLPVGLFGRSRLARALLGCGPLEAPGERRLAAPSQAEGQVTFRIAGLQPLVARVDATGTASTTVTVPAGTAAATYAVTADYTDDASPANFQASSGDGSLVVNPAVPQVTVENDTLTFDPRHRQTVPLRATLTSDGAPVGEGTVSFVVSAQPPDGGPAVVLGLAQAQVNPDGVATTALRVPAGSPAGTYTIQAVFTDTPGSGNYSTGGGAGTLTINPLATTTTLGPVRALVFSAGSGQSVRLTAHVRTDGRPPAGVVTFTVGGLAVVSVRVRQGGLASADITVPAGTPAGDYTVRADYADLPNALGAVNHAASSDTGTLVIQAAPTQVRVDPVRVPFRTADQSVTVTAHVTMGSGDSVAEGNVTFTLGDQTVTARVNAQGDVVVALAVEAGTAPGRYTLTASYADDRNANGAVNYAADTGRGTLTVTSEKEEEM